MVEQVLQQNPKLRKQTQVKEITPAYLHAQFSKFITAGHYFQSNIRGTFSRITLTRSRWRIYTWLHRLRGTEVFILDGAKAEEKDQMHKFFAKENYAPKQSLQSLIGLEKLTVYLIQQGSNNYKMMLGVWVGGQFEGIECQVDLTFKQLKNLNLCE